MFLEEKWKAQVMQGNLIFLTSREYSTQIPTQQAKFYFGSQFLFNPGAGI